MCTVPNHQLARTACYWPRSGCPEDFQTPEGQEALAVGEESPAAYKHKPLEVIHITKDRTDGGMMT